jgi:hypothetical protein
MAQALQLSAMLGRPTIWNNQINFGHTRQFLSCPDSDMEPLFRFALPGLHMPASLQLCDLGQMLYLNTLMSLPGACEGQN